MASTRSPPIVTWNQGFMKAPRQKSMVLQTCIYMRFSMGLMGCVAHLPLSASELQVDMKRLRDHSGDNSGLCVNDQWMLPVAKGISSLSEFKFPVILVQAFCSAHCAHIEFVPLVCPNCNSIHYVCHVSPCLVVWGLSACPHAPFP